MTSGHKTLHDDHGRPANQTHGAGRHRRSPRHSRRRRGAVALKTRPLAAAITAVVLAGTASSVAAVGSTPTGAEVRTQLARAQLHVDVASSERTAAVPTVTVTQTATPVRVTFPEKRPPTATVTETVTAFAAPSTVESSVATPTSEATSVPGEISPLTAGLYLPYSVGSYFTSSVAGAPIDEALTASFRSFMRSHPDQRGITYPKLTGVGGNEWGAPYVIGTASDPIWRFIGTTGDPTLDGPLKEHGFHAPDILGDLITGTSDSPVTIEDRATGWTVWGFQAQLVGPRTVQVSAAALFEHASNGLDRRDPLADSTLNLSRSRGGIPDAMMVTRERLDWAVAHHSDLGHVFHLFFVETDSSKGSTHPMVNYESGKSGWGAEGWRIAVDPNVDLSTRPCSPEALAIALTFQRHGGYLGDNSGSSTVLKAQQDDARGSVWGDRLHADELKDCISWDDFVVVRPGWQ